MAFSKASHVSVLTDKIRDESGCINDLLGSKTIGQNDNRLVIWNSIKCSNLEICDFANPKPVSDLSAKTRYADRTDQKPAPFCYKV